MFESLPVKFKTKSLERTGYLTNDRIKEITSQEGFVSNLFKSSDQQISEIQSECEHTFNFEITKANASIKEHVTKAHANVAQYITEMANIAKQIKTKQFDSAAFSNIKVVRTTYKYDIINHGLNKIGDVVTFINLQFEDYLEKTTKLQGNMNWFHDKNDAYISYDICVMLPEFFIDDDGEFYTISAGDLLTKGDYPTNFVAQVSNSTNSLSGGVNSVLSCVSKLSQIESFVQNTFQNKSGSPSDYRKRCHHAIQTYKFATETLETAIHSVSSTYLTEAVRISKLIVSNCYK